MTLVFMAVVACLYLRPGCYFSRATDDGYRGALVLLLVLVVVICVLAVLVVVAFKVVVVVFVFTLLVLAAVFETFCKVNTIGGLFWYKLGI